MWMLSTFRVLLMPYMFKVFFAISFNSSSIFELQMNLYILSLVPCSLLVSALDHWHIALSNSPVASMIAFANFAGVPLDSLEFTSLRLTRNDAFIILSVFFAVSHFRLQYEPSTRMSVLDPNFIPSSLSGWHISSNFSSVFTIVSLPISSSDFFPIRVMWSANSTSRLRKASLAPLPFAVFVSFGGKQFLGVRCHTVPQVGFSSSLFLVAVGIDVEWYKLKSTGDFWSPYLNLLRGCQLSLFPSFSLTLSKVSSCWLFKCIMS